jgi:hypothetical protein
MTDRYFMVIAQIKFFNIKGHKLCKNQAMQHQRALRNSTIPFSTDCAYFWQGKLRCWEYFRFPSKP